MAEFYDKNQKPIIPNEMYKGHMFLWAYFTREDDSLRAHVLDTDVSREFVLGQSSFDTVSLQRVNCANCSKKLDFEECTPVLTQISVMDSDSKWWFERAKEDLGLVQIVEQT